MKSLHLLKMCVVTALVVLGTAFCLHNAIAAPRDGTDSVEGMEVLTRGPVHEAFATTVTYDPEPGIIVPRVPPEPIEELPPDQRPVGDNVEWIPGYWGWDDERQDFLWVSGLWRNLPPGREWVAGYWGQSRQGAQWTSGYWADATSTEREYLPEPPATAEVGPNIAQPSPDYTWLPGTWMWQQNRYVWRPGFWGAGQQDWDWVPSHYQWTPRGYVYVDGYYDYAVDHRGVLFSPVYFSSSVYGRQGFSYSPSVAINLAGFMNHLFLRPSYGHYYFGDYYGSDYSTAGFYPWFAYSSGGYGYDPFYAQQRWQHRWDSDWAHGIEADFHNRRDHDDARPPRTWRAQQELITTGSSKDKGFVVATPYHEVLKSKNIGTRFQRVDQAERQRFGKRGLDVQKFRAERQKLEMDAAPISNVELGKELQPAKVKLPRSPVVAKRADQLGKDNTIPPKYQAPELDPKVEPKPRQARGGPVARGKPNVIKPQESPQGQPNGGSAGKRQRASDDKPKPQVQLRDLKNIGPTAREPGANAKDPRSQPNPQGGVRDPSQGTLRPESGGKPQGTSNNKPQGTLKRESGGSPQGASNDKPQGTSQKTPQGGSQDKPRKKPKK